MKSLDSRIVLLDTSMDSDNDGDQIIVDSIMREIPELRSAARVATHRFLTWQERQLVAQAKLLIVTGTNILSSRLWKPQQWLMTPIEWVSFRRKVVFLGVGWRQYQSRPDMLSEWLIGGISSRDIPVATRDSYTKEKLDVLSVSASFTGCPTMWSLPDELPPLSGSGNAVFTVTDYKRSQVADQFILDSVAGMYSGVRIWPQGDGDREYISQLSLPQNSTVIDRGLKSFETALIDAEYFGTRLHAGVRASQLGRPAAIVAVDNRALEIGRDTGFLVASREAAVEDWGAVTRRFTRDASVPLELQREAIATWKASLRQLI